MQNEKLEKEMRINLSKWITELPPSEALYKAVRCGCIIQNMTLPTLAKDLCKSPQYVSDVLKGNRNSESTKALLKEIRQLAAPIELTAENQASST